MSNYYIVRVKTFDELKKTNESYDDIMLDMNLIQLFRRYGGTKQKVYCDKSDNNIYYSNKVLSDNDLLLDECKRYFYNDELVFLEKNINIKLDNNLFEME